MCNKDFAKFLPICGEVHETPNDIEFRFLSSHPIDPIPQLFHHQRNRPCRNNISRLVQCSGGDIDENPASVLLLVSHFYKIVT
jgi:hypothetical protein